MGCGEDVLEVKIPTLSEKSGEGWGTLVLIFLIGLERRRKLEDHAPVIVLPTSRFQIEIGDGYFSRVP